MRARISLEAGDCLPQTLDLSPGQPVTLGRSRDNTIVLRDELASRLHAKIYFEDSRWHIRDFGLNGTRVDGIRVNGAVELGDGKKIKIGEVVIRFAIEPKSVATMAKGTAPLTSTANPAQTMPSMPSAAQTMPSTVNPAQTLPVRTLPGENPHTNTKIHEIPGERTVPGDSDLAASQLRMDELTALCKFMTQTVETRSPHELIALALRSILHQTTAKLAGYLSLDPEDPTPKVVMPESAAWISL